MWVVLAVAAGAILVLLVANLSSSEKKIEHEIEREPSEALDEVEAVGAQDAAVGLAEAIRGARPHPLPFRRQSEVLLGEDALDIFGAPTGVEWRMVFRALGKDGGCKHGGGQGLPEEYVSVEMDEGLLLSTVGHKFAQRPPPRITATIVIEFGGHVTRAVSGKYFRASRMERPQASR